MMNVIYAILCGLQALCFIKAIFGLIATILSMYVKENEKAITAARLMVIWSIRVIVFTVILIVL